MTILTSIRAFVLWVPWCLLAVICSGQRFQNLNDEVPMALSEVLFQDREGFLWIGTINGLVRYDGYESQYFLHEPEDSSSLAGNNINSIGQDAAGRIWVGMSSFGLDILDPEWASFRHICLPDNQGACFNDISVNGFAAEGDSIMWVATEKGLYQFTTDDQPVMRRRYIRDTVREGSLSSTFTLQVLLDHRDRLWVGTINGLNLLDRSTGRFFNYQQQETFPHTQILCIAEDRTGKIWVSPRYREERLIWYNEGAREFIADPEFRGTQFGEFKMTFDPDNNCWISSRGVGIYVHQAKTGKTTFYDPEIPARHGYRNIYGLQPLCDRYGNLWIAGQQVMKWPATHKAIHQIYLGQSPVISVFGNEDGVWFSDDVPKRLLYAAGRMEEYWPAGLPTPAASRALDPATRKVYCIKPLGKDQIIMAATRNILIWNLRTNHFKDFPTSYGGPFRDFAITPDQTHLWICGNQGKPIYFNLQTGQYERPDYLHPVHSPYCVAISKQGDLWFGSFSNGVYHVDDDTHEIENFTPDAPDPAHQLTDFSVNDIAITPDQIVWVGTNLGVNRIDPSTHQLTYLRKQTNFSDEGVMSVLDDNLGNVWFGTQHGLVRYDTLHHSFSVFNKNDGLINAVYSIGACYRDEQGLLYFAGDRGIDIIDPSQIGTNPVPPDLYLGHVWVNNQPADTTIRAAHLRDLALPYNKNFIEVELLALHLTAPSANQYSYRIPELHTEWRDLDTRRNITLANLSPGQYTLQARAANADGLWSGDKTLLHIIIHPPFWMTWWFITLLVLSFLGFVLVIYQFRIRQIQVREQLKTAFNKRIAEMESKALRAQMNPHFLFNSLNSVKSLISQGENEKATQYLTRFGELIRQVLSNSERPLVRLQEELHALELYLEIEQLRFQNFTYAIRVGESVNADFIEVPPLILQPYVENAIWHGLMHKDTGDRKVTVEVERQDGILCLTIDDNGIGRGQSDKIKVRGNRRKGGLGMRLTGDRLRLLHKIYGRDVRIQITDLQNEEGKALGTRVEIMIPYPE